MKGLPRESFATILSECCLAVWVDQISGFGTFPIEAMKCNVPVIGRVPNIVPEWMEQPSGEGQEKTLKDNGIWTFDTVKIVDLIATFIRLWLEDNIPADVYEKTKDTIENYTMEKMRNEVTNYYNRQINERIAELSLLITKPETTNA